MTPKTAKDTSNQPKEVPKPPPTGEPCQAHLQPNALEFKKQLLADRSEVGICSVLFKWYHYYHSMYCFHNGAKSHHFLQCYITDKICQETNDTDLLNTVKQEYGVSQTAPLSCQPSLLWVSTCNCESFSFSTTCMPNICQLDTIPFYIASSLSSLPS